MPPRTYSGSRADLCASRGLRHDLNDPQTTLPSYGLLSATICPLCALGALQELRMCPTVPGEPDPAPLARTHAIRGPLLEVPLDGLGPYAAALR